MTALVSEDKLALISQSHARQLALCDDLETIADGLPGNVNRQLCLHLARAVCPTVAAAHEVEERVLFAAVKTLSTTLPDIESTIERLRWEHFEDMCFAEELHDSLLSIGRGEPSMTPEAAGYMLRGFFESVRRHIAFEREMLSPLMELALRKTEPGRLNRNAS
ncbi:MAG: hemerythrin domain-containing protein [Mesorhizobium sp.]|nr:hemerythrin domain-containing protein [Mesorhizobium sp.]MBL8579127.1 hemerythrin domain-containing protein [Mesorhizobium sp.]